MKEVKRTREGPLCDGPWRRALRHTATPGVVAALLLLASPGGMAASTAIIPVTVTVLAPTCTINNGGRVDVDFGTRVGVGKVDGVNYRQAVNYRIACKGSGSQLTLSLKGTAAGFDGAALGTTMENLGIRIYQDGTPFRPGDTLKINLTSPPKLEAVPVKRSGATLTEGAFEAVAMLQAEYQ